MSQSWYLGQGCDTSWIRGRSFVTRDLPSTSSTPPRTHRLELANILRKGLLSYMPLAEGGLLGGGNSLRKEWGDCVTSPPPSWHTNPNPRVSLRMEPLREVPQEPVGPPSPLYHMYSPPRLVSTPSIHIWLNLIVSITSVKWFGSVPSVGGVLWSGIWHLRKKKCSVKRKYFAKGKFIFWMLCDSVR